MRCSHGQATERQVRLYALAVMLALAACAQQHEQPASQPVATVPDEPVNAGTPQVGKASIYSNSFAGKRTASGTTLDTSADVVASNSLPLGSKAKVTNLETGKSAVVTVEDRGRLPKGRVDLTPATAQKIGLSQKQGVAPVAVQPVAATQP
jgi:rare lipoprotein A